jgi:predicted GNAT family acetyltransferase
LAPDAVVERDESTSRFVIRSGKEHPFLRYNQIGSHIVLEHTEVPRAQQGQGLAGALAKAALEYARENNLSVIPVCPFVLSYLSRHPEYQSLVKRGGTGERS